MPAGSAVDPVRELVSEECGAGDGWRKREFPTNLLGGEILGVTGRQVRTTFEEIKDMART